MSVSIEHLIDHEHRIPTIARWYFDEWGRTEQNFNYESVITQLELSLTKDSIPMSLVAIENNKTVGAAQLKTREMAMFPDREYWLGGVYVDHSFRGKRIAEQLCEAAKEIAVSLGVKELYLQTEHTDGGGLYARLGWRGLEQIRMNEYSVLVMVNRLFEEERAP